MSAFGHEEEMRAELGAAVRGLFVRPLAEVGPLDEAETERLIALSRLACRARSAVERDRVSREIELISPPEAPARLAKMLARLLGGMVGIGVPRETAWEVTAKVAMDSIPAIRRQLLDDLAVLDAPAATSDLADDAGYPTTTTRRALEDLAAHGLVLRASAEKGKAHTWRLSELTRDLSRKIGWVGVGGYKAAPEGGSGGPKGSPDIAGKPSADDWRDDLEPGERGLS
jgi:hypothetical protein